MMKETRVTHEFPAFYQKDSKILILGSFPSVKSREQQFYYANPGNRFFPVLAKVFNDDRIADIEERKEFLKRHKIALFDVIGECTIQGSSDSSIKDVVVNDIPGIIEQTEIEAVFTTGKLATKLYEQYFKDLDVLHIGLPSTSGANARKRFEDLVEDYQILVEYKK